MMISENLEKRTDRGIRIPVRKIAVILMICAVLLFMLISTYFIAHEADHKCSGGNCPVCVLLQMSEDNLRQLGGCVPAAAAESLFIFLIVVMKICADFSITVSTPVSRKIRLNN